MPGYTHLQHAQPISFAHHLLAYYQMFSRDSQRFAFNLEHTDLSPLGAAALAAAVLVFLYYRHTCKKQFGGITGDLAGYFLQLCELAMLTVIVLAGGIGWR